MHKCASSLPIIYMKEPLFLSSSLLIFFFCAIDTVAVLTVSVAVAFAITILASTVISTLVHIDIIDDNRHVGQFIFALNLIDKVE